MPITPSICIAPYVLVTLAVSPSVRDMDPLYVCPSLPYLPLAALPCPCPFLSLLTPAARLGVSLTAA